ncbi:MAG: guanylate kinase [Gemmatimonadota bacterium]
MKEPSLEVRPVVLSAPSGAGKTTIARALVEREEDFSFSVSATTRPPREHEVHGVDYWFVSEDEFRSMVGNGEFAEWAEVHGDLYGTPLESLLRAGSRGRHVVLDIDVQGALQIREAVPEALLLFILPPSVDILFERLLGRGTEREETLRRRLTTALHELRAAESFDFFIVNEELDEAIREVRDLVRRGEAPPGGTSGELADALELLAGVEELLKREQLKPPN